MGKASRRKRERQATEQSHTRQTGLERLPGTFVAVTGHGAAIAESGPLGGVLAGFDAAESARAAAARAGSADADVEQLKSAADLLDLFGDSGATALRLGDDITIHAGCTLDALVDDAPTLLFTGTFDRPLRYMTRAGYIDDWPSNRQIHPWRRWDVIDANLADLEPTALTSGARWWELASEDAVALIAESDVLGPFPSLFGAVLFFSTRERAQCYADSLPGDASASIHLGPTAGGPIRARPVASLAERLHDIMPGAGATTPVILNPGGPRHQTAFGTVGSPWFRTVSGLWELKEATTFEPVRDFDTFAGTDTFHWRGGSTINLEPLARTHRRAVKEETPETDLSYLDSFLIILEDRYDPAASSWRLTATVADAVAALTDLEQRRDLQTRTRPGGDLPWLVVPSAGHRREQARSKDFARAADIILTELRDRGYQPRDAERIAAAANEVMGGSRVRAVGWVRDLVVASRDLPDLLDDLLEMSGDERPDLLRWIKDNDLLPVAAEAREALIGVLGDDTWAALDPRSRHFLGSAWLHLDTYSDRSDVDHSTVVIMCGKAVEVELADLFGSFRSTENSHAPHSEVDRNDKALRAFLDGTGRLTLGGFPYLLRPKESDSELRTALKRHLCGLPHGDTLVSKRFTNKLNSLSNARNPASHDSAVTSTDAENAFEKLVGDEGILPHLVAWKLTEPADQPGDLTVPIPFPFRTTEHGRVAERYVPRFNDEAGLGPRSHLDLPPKAQDQDQDHEESWLETLDWMVASGLLDEMEASGEVAHEHATQFRALHARAQQLSNKAPPRAAPLPQKLIHKLLFEPETLGTSRVVDDRTGEAYWPLVPGAVLAFDTQGVALLLARGAPTDVDPAADIFQLSFDDRTVASLNEWLQADRAPIWRHRRDLLTVQSGEKVDGQATLRVVLRRSRPPGGHFPIHLDPEASERLSVAIAELANGIWGRLATASRPGHSRPTRT